MTAPEQTSVFASTGPVGHAEAVARVVHGAGRIRVERAPEGYDALICADVLSQRGGLGLFIARDERRMEMVAEAVAFFAPHVDLVRLPGWDCQPYDRVSPSAGASATRTATLARLARRRGADADQAPLLVLSTVSGVSQRCAPSEVLAASGYSAQVGDAAPLEQLLGYLSENGYRRVGAVLEPGDYAVRGGVTDVFAPGRPEPVRLDFFGDTLESVRSFDPETQRSTGNLSAIAFDPVSEVLLNPDTIARFRRAFTGAFGGVGGGDPVYEAVTAGARAQGVEHWLSFFYERLETVFDVVGSQAQVFLDHLAEPAFQERAKTIGDYYAARKEAGLGGSGAFAAPAYRAVEPQALYLGEGEWAAQLSARDVCAFSSFSGDAAGVSVDAGARPGRDFAAERKTEGVNVFEAAAEHVRTLLKSGRRVVLASWSSGASERTAGVFADHGLDAVRPITNWSELETLPKSMVARAVFPLERGFETDAVAVVSEQDILGDRLSRPRKRRRAANFIAEAGVLSVGDLVVHVDHGIGRYTSLRTIVVQDTAHDCLEIEYAGASTLLLPVENIELLSRYGGDETAAVLDKLGGAAWQGRKARAKKRLRDMAEELIRLAAARAVRKADPVDADAGLYDEFASRFPYAETDDQLAAIDDVFTDLASGRPMDRLICGDVGFGKTEVALRAAFVVAMSGRQVAIVAPTTLLARQHFNTFTERFRGWPVKVAQLSRLVTAKQASEVKEGLASGAVDVVVGTHAVLAKSVTMKDVGLIIIDEEQHFGVRHKERLKELRANVNVLTLTATPIPRTLQMSLSGLRDLSIIATPPIDRLAVRTTVAPFDPVTVREALLRELYRGGQSFFVVPRIKDLGAAEEFLSERVPEVRSIIAHGQMSPSELEDRINTFYEGRADVLLSTPIVESGLDIPTANTLIVHRADMFGLAQLYQLRGRVGRSKTRAYAYLTVPADFRITPAAERRLEVLQSLDTLGAGFTLASHDLDLRGGGNLLGEEQSGHIRDVGVELFQSMLEEAVATLRDDPDASTENEPWSPQINVGASILIPETYVPDLDLRLGLYRRLASLDTHEAREGFAAELIDRFGPLPDEVEHLMSLLHVKALCRQAGVAKLDVGEKGAVAQFRPGAVPDPAPLIALIANRPAQFKLRPDERLFMRGDWPTPSARLKGARNAMAHVVRAVAPTDLETQADPTAQ